MAAGAFLVPRETSMLILILNVFSLAFIASVFQTVGSFVIYGIAWKFQSGIVNKLNFLHGLTEHDVQKIHQKFSKKNKMFSNLTWKIILARAIPIIPLSVISAGCGLIKLDWKTYSLTTLIGVFVRNIFLVIVGYVLSTSYFIFIANSLDKIELFVLIGIIGMVILIKKLKMTEKVLDKIF